MPRTRTAGLWIASVLFAVVLLLLLIFILQNGQRAEINFFGAHASPPIGVALLLAAVFGVLLVALPGSARIVQLRFLARRRRAEIPPPDRNAMPDVPPAGPGRDPALPAGPDNPPPSTVDLAGPLDQPGLRPQPPVDQERM